MEVVTPQRPFQEIPHGLSTAANRPERESGLAAPVRQDGEGMCQAQVVIAANGLPTCRRRSVATAIEHSCLAQVAAGTPAERRGGLLPGVPTANSQDHHRQDNRAEQEHPSSKSRAGHGVTSMIGELAGFARYRIGKPWSRWGFLHLFSGRRKGGRVRTATAITRDPDRFVRVPQTYGVP